jgi:hypothetical protein
MVLVAGFEALAPASYCQMRRNRRKPIPQTLLAALLVRPANLGLTRSGGYSRLGAALTIAKHANLPTIASRGVCRYFYLSKLLKSAIRKPRFVGEPATLFRSALRYKLRSSPKGNEMTDQIDNMDFSVEESVVNACVSHARKMLESQRIGATT